jgi:hypothetical protein
MHLCCYEAKQPNLKLKTQLLGSLLLAFALPVQATGYVVHQFTLVKYLLYECYTPVLL